MKKHPEIRSILALLFSLGCFLIVIIMMFHPIPPENKDLVNIAIGALLTGGLAAVVSFYFGAAKSTHEIPNQTQQTMTTVFWDIQSLNDAVVEVNGVSAQYQSVSALTSQNQNYSIVPDNTNVPVLTFSGQSTSTLKLQGVNGVYQVTSVQSSFAGGRPTRPR